MANAMNLCDHGNRILQRLRAKPSSFGLVPGSNLLKLQAGDIKPLSKKSYVFYLNYENNPGMSRIIFLKIAEDQTIKFFHALDITGVSEE